MSERGEGGGKCRYIPVDRPTACLEAVYLLFARHLVVVSKHLDSAVPARRFPASVRRSFFIRGAMRLISQHRRETTGRPPHRAPETATNQLNSTQQRHF